MFISVQLSRKVDSNKGYQIFETVASQSLIVLVHLFLQDTQEKEGILPERAEEAKLKAKYPSLGQKPGGSDFLMKRLQKGVWGTISDPLTLEPKGIRSVESLLNADLEVELLGSSEKELEDVKSKANYWKSLIRCQ